MVPVRPPLSQPSRNIRAKQAPRAPGQVRARELMHAPNFGLLVALSRKSHAVARQASFNELAGHIKPIGEALGNNAIPVRRL